MKFIFLSVLSAIALNTLSFAPSYKNNGNNLKISNVNDANEELDAQVLRANNSGDYIQCTGELVYRIDRDKVEYYNGHGQCWYQLYDEVLIKDVPEDEWNSVTYVDYENNCSYDFYSDEIYFNKDTGYFQLSFYSRDVIEGYIVINYTYMHDASLETWPDPVDDRGFVNPPVTQYMPKKTVYRGGRTEDDTIEEARQTLGAFKAQGYLEPTGVFTKSPDKDWFKFSTNERVKYKISFLAPNNDYKLTIYKSRRLNQNNYDVVQRYSWRKKANASVFLTAGTYYVCVSLENVDSYANSPYSLALSYTQTNKEFPIYYNNLKKFNAVVWENDYLPDNVGDRWKRTRFELHTLTMNTYLPHQEGYVDEIFYDSGLNTNKTILDSVIYVWGHDELEMLTKALQTLQKTLRQKEKELRRYKEITADVVSIMGGALQLVLSGISIYNGGVKETIAATSIDDASTIAGVGDNAKSVAEAICDLILGTIPTELDYFTVQDSALSLLIGCCDGLVGDPKGVLCIPVYAQIKRETYVDRGLQIYEYQRSFVPFQRLYKSTNDESSWPTNKFKMNTISEHQYIHRVENDEIVGTRYYHGSLHSFTSADDLKDYISYDYIMEGNI